MSTFALVGSMGYFTERQMRGCIIIIIVSLFCSNGAILVYDITDEDSFFKVWYTFLELFSSCVDDHFCHLKRSIDF